MNIENYSIEQLKALAYDILAQQQQLQTDLATVNQLIAQRAKETKDTKEFKKDK